MTIDADRPQDVGRSHVRRSQPAPATLDVLERYRAALRAELDDTLDEIRPAAGQLTIAGEVDRPNLERRRALWDLAVKLARELAGGDDLDPLPEDGAEPVRTAGGRPVRKAPRLTRAQRRTLGG